MPTIKTKAEAKRIRSAMAASINWRLVLSKAPKPHSKNRKRAIDRCDAKIEDYAWRLANWEARQA